MKRLLPLTILALALAVPTAAFAKTSYWRAENGSGAASITATGSCSARKGLLLLTMSCSGGSGSVTARYDFAVPRSVTGTIDRKVSYTGSAPTVKLTRVGTRVSVFVTRSGANTRTTIQMVCVSFYK